MIHATARGSTWHARLAPKVHRFQYQSAMVYLDLDRLNDFQQTALKVNQTGLLSFKTERHLCDDAHPSGDAARQFASSALGVELSGPVKLLTNPHCLGLGFNPLSVYFLHHHNETPGALIYEVSNTPWNEIHRYVIPYSNVANGETFTSRHLIRSRNVTSLASDGLMKIKSRFISGFKTKATSNSCLRRDYSYR